MGTWEVVRDVGGWLVEWGCDVHMMYEHGVR